MIIFLSLFNYANAIKVIASFSILADVIKNIGGDKVHVVSIVGPNEDAHVYEPTPDTVKLILYADIVFINGLGFEWWLKKIIQACDYTGEVIDTSSGVPIINIKEKDNIFINDPHVWNDVSNVIIWVENIKQALQKIDPQNWQYYEKRAGEYLGKLYELDLYIREKVDKFKDFGGIVVTSHDAFGYFSKAYGVKFLTPQGISTESEPSACEVAEIIRVIRDKKIRKIFVENIANQDIIKRICDETDAEIGGVLYSDALSETEGSASSYISLMQSNVDNIVQSFQ